jgi:hypothetical protein
LIRAAADYLAGVFLTGFLLFFGLLVAFIMLGSCSLKVAITGIDINPGLCLAATWRLKPRRTRCRVNGAGQQGVDSILRKLHLGHQISQL